MLVVMILLWARLLFWATAIFYEGCFAHTARTAFDEGYLAFTLSDFSGHRLLIKIPRPTGKAKLIKAIT